MLPDYHIHTALCKHAEGNVADYKAAARMRMIPEICFTDHIPSPDGYDDAHRMEITQINCYKSMVISLKSNEAPKVMLGIESDYYEGCEAFLREWLPAQGFDFVLGSVHFINDWGFDNPAHRHIWDSVDVKATWLKYFELIGRLADSGLFDALSHLDLPKKFGHRPSDKALKEMAQPVLDRIAKAGMGIELNTSGLNKPVGEIYPSPLIVSMALEREIPICFGSDSHVPEDVGRNFDLALKLAREAGYTHHFKISQRIKKLIPLPETLSVRS
ncbi:MAG: histidinol-phosphatase HisJ family protein [Deltaproteobacteria bacterium]|nr:histidinol-phosphatase HisJ family protein [Deltaproteobacteria bacterium]